MADLTNAERETCISMTADNRDMWHVFSDDPVMQRRFEAIGATLTRERGTSKWYTLPANQVSLRNPSKLTEEQRQELSRRARERFAAKESLED